VIHQASRASLLRFLDCVAEKVEHAIRVGGYLHLEGGDWSQ
jgi:hypothetical protein